MKGGASMTHNQIDYWNLVENRRHNLIAEQINQQEADTRSGTLEEVTRHNYADEGLRLAGIQQQDIASQRSASAQMYSSDNALYASKYASDTSAATQRYTSELNAQTQRYNADLSAATQRYTSDINAASQKYNVDAQSENVKRQTETTQRGQDINLALQQWNNLMSYTDWVTDRFNIFPELPNGSSKSVMDIGKYLLNSDLLKGEK